jgi:hypothetical protein
MSEVELEFLNGNYRKVIDPFIKSENTGKLSAIER